MKKSLLVLLPLLTVALAGCNNNPTTTSGEGPTSAQPTTGPSTPTPTTGTTGTALAEKEVLVEMYNVNVGWGDHQVLKNLCWEVKKGQHFLIRGPNGSGKTTTAMKISEALETKGIKTHSVSMDDYFKTISPETTLEFVTLLLYDKVA